MHPGESWHGFKDIPDNWVCSTRLKSASLLREWVKMVNGRNRCSGGAGHSLAWSPRHLPTRTTDFQIMFLFSMGVTRGNGELWLTPFAPSNATMTPTTAGAGDAGTC